MKKNITMTYTNLIACRVCAKIFPRVVPLLYHFDQVHGRKGYILVVKLIGGPLNLAPIFT